MRKNISSPLFIRIDTYIFLAVIFLGSLFRFVGISKNLSFWNDEGQVALMSRGILEYGKPITSIGAGGGIYQVALYYITALSFKIFGISEWAGRFPSIIAGVLLIALGFSIGKKLFNLKTAVIISILLSFSQIQLAWSTQLRPYVWLELFTLLVMYFSYKYIKYSRTVININLFILVFISCISVLFHGTGLLNILLVFFVLIYKSIKIHQYKYFLLLPIFIILGFFVIQNSFGGRWVDIYRTLFLFYFSPLHYRIFLTHNYLWLLVGSFIGLIILFRKDKELACLLGGSALIIFLSAIFKISPNYVRYSLPAFPLLYILFSVGVVFVLDKFIKNERLRWVLILIIFVLLSFTNKFILVPQYYYSINADMRENPITDYKLAFSKIKTLIEDKKDVLIIDAWNDRVPWYLPGQEFVMTNYASPIGYDIRYGEKLAGTLEAIKNEISIHKHGVVIVEDWDSLMTEDIKEYIRKNLKFEFTVQDLPFNEKDHWGISVYSWGL